MPRAALGYSCSATCINLFGSHGKRYPVRWRQTDVSRHPHWLKPANSSCGSIIDRFHIAYRAEGFSSLYPDASQSLVCTRRLPGPVAVLIMHSKPISAAQQLSRLTGLREDYFSRHNSAEEVIAATVVGITILGGGT